jgi:hypothetical protein
MSYKQWLEPGLLDVVKPGDINRFMYFNFKQQIIIRYQKHQKWDASGEPIPRTFQDLVNAINEMIY